MRTVRCSGCLWGGGGCLPARGVVQSPPAAPWTCGQTNTCENITFSQRTVITEFAENVSGNRKGKIKQGYIPVGCVPSAVVAVCGGGVCLQGGLYSPPPAARGPVDRQTPVKTLPFRNGR